MTNGDKVRSMTNNELAVVLALPPCEEQKQRGGCHIFATCMDCFLDWLDQDAEPLKVGDEVVFCGHTGVIIDLDPGEDSAKILWKHLSIHSGLGIKRLVEGRTGRHFPEVEALLKAMKGEENG